MARVDKQKKKSITNNLTLWVTLAFLLAAAGGFFAWLQVTQYEEGVVEVYATSQDAYVQLVLDQINLNSNQADEQVIVDIIGTLDSSTNKYWTLAGNSAIIFVKDVTETNRYKGFTTETYYISDSAKEYIDSLMVNKVIHSVIEIDGKDYIASGVRFLFQGAEYQICLLTNPDAVLDHNSYLGAKINLTVMLVTLLCVFLVTVIFLARGCSQRNSQLESEEKHNEELVRKIEKLNQELSMNKLYDTGLAVFKMETLPMFLEKLEATGKLPVVMMLLEYDEEEHMRAFLEDSYLLLDKRVIRFRDEVRKKLFLVTVGMDKEGAMEKVNGLPVPGVRLRANAYVTRAEKGLLMQAAMKIQEKGGMADGR